MAAEHGLDNAHPGTCPIRTGTKPNSSIVGRNAGSPIIWKCFRFLETSVNPPRSFASVMSSRRFFQGPENAVLVSGGDRHIVADFLFDRKHRGRKRSGMPNSMP